MMNQLTEDDIAILELVGESFLYIRAIAERGACNNLSDREKLKLIAELADASHNLPKVIATGGKESQISFLLGDAKRLETTLIKVRGK